MFHGPTHQLVVLMHEYHMPVVELSVCLGLLVNQSVLCPHNQVVAPIRLKAFPACKEKTRHNLSEQAVKYSQKCFVQISQLYDDIWRSENASYLYPSMHNSFTLTGHTVLRSMIVIANCNTQNLRTEGSRTIRHHPIKFIV